jgi:hypothetical protein
VTVAGRLVMSTLVLAAAVVGCDAHRDVAGRPVMPTSPAASAGITSYALPGMPPSFVAVVSGRLAVFDSRTGRQTRFLTHPPVGDHDDDPVIEQAPNGSRSVMFVRTDPHSCGSAVLKTSLSGHGRATVVFSRPRTAIGSIGADRRGERFAVATEDCRLANPFTIVRVFAPGQHQPQLILTAKLPPRSNFVWGVGPLMVWHDAIAVSLGEHNFSGTVVSRVPRHPEYRKIDSGRFFPSPGGRDCDGTNPLPSVTHGRTTWTSSTSCVLGDRKRSATFLVTYGWPDITHYESGFVLIKRGDPSFADLTGSDERGHFIGTRSGDHGDRAIFYTDGRRQVVLPTCRPTEPALTSTCPDEPVW